VIAAWIAINGQFSSGDHAPSTLLAAAVPEPAARLTTTTMRDTSLVSPVVILAGMVDNPTAIFALMH
jgi:hypothetical protein